MLMEAGMKADCWMIECAIEPRRCNTISLPARGGWPRVSEVGWGDESTVKNSRMATSPHPAASRPPSPGGEGAHRPSRARRRMVNSRRLCAALKAPAKTLHFRRFRAAVKPAHTTPEPHPRAAIKFKNRHTAPMHVARRGTDQDG